MMSPILERASTKVRMMMIMVNRQKNQPPKSAMPYKMADSREPSASVWRTP